MAGLAALIVAVAAFAQAVSGFGFAVAGVPLLSLVVDPKMAVVAMTVIGVVVAGGAWRQEREHVEGAAVRHLVLAGSLGVPLGLVFLVMVPSDILLVTIGLTVFATAWVVATDLSVTPNHGVQCSLGVVSGVFLASTGINGPPLVLALSARKLPKHRFRATLQSIFFFQEILVVLAFLALGLLSHELLTIVVAGLLGAPLGWFAGTLVFDRLTPNTFRTVVCAGLLAAGAAAVASALG